VKNQFIALAFAAASLTSFSAAYAAQHGQQLDCKCNQQSFWVDNPSTTWPSCVSSFGISWTSAQKGICVKPGCPSPRPCTGQLTASGTGSCAWITSAATENGEIMGGQISQGSFSHTIDYSIDCGHYWDVTFVAEGVELGWFVFVCLDCGEDE
jgi:hypothetical protein